jgi:S1-C subfamily serine protease
VGRVVPDLIAQGYYAHPWLGADVIPLTASLTRSLRQAGVDISVESGLLVLQTTAGGPAGDAGIRGGSQWVRLGRYRFPVGGDVITAIDGQPVADLETLTVYLETETAIGDTVNITALRQDRTLTIPITLAGQPQP